MCRVASFPTGHVIPTVPSCRRCSDTFVARAAVGDRARAHPARHMISFNRALDVLHCREI